MKRAYGCSVKDDKVRLESSSGGVYAELAKNIVKAGGIVYAAVYQDDCSVYHQKLVNEEDIKKSLGSKYMQSSLKGSFKEIMNALLNSQKVLFVGTPCQVLGLKSYLRCKLCPMDTLSTIDLACHGVPSYYVFDSYLKSLNRKIKKVNMRDKSSGWSYWRYSLRIDTDNGFILQSQIKNIYMWGFREGVFLRPACEYCTVKGLDRVSDMTLADFWGVWDILPELDDNKGTSLVFVHTDIGQRFFDQIRDKLTYKELSEAQISFAAQQNKGLLKRAVAHPKRCYFFKKLASGRDFSRIIYGIKLETLLRIKVGNMVVNIKKLLKIN
jgi:coenzyme F420-reducing hydrogenase beta subunit